MTKNELFVELEQFLKTNRIYSKFMRNLEKLGFKDTIVSELVYLSNPITNSFPWVKTPEGFTFWSDIDDLWSEYLQRLAYLQRNKLL